MSQVRGLAIDVAGRLSVKNPAYVMPQLRRHLMQLLNDMDHSPDSLQREGGAPCSFVFPEELLLSTNLRPKHLSALT